MIKIFWKGNFFPHPVPSHKISCYCCCSILHGPSKTKLGDINQEESVLSHARRKQNGKLGALSQITQWHYWQIQCNLLSIFTWVFSHFSLPQSQNESLLQKTKATDMRKLTSTPPSRFNKSSFSIIWFNYIYFVLFLRNGNIMNTLIYFGNDSPSMMLILLLRNVTAIWICCALIFKCKCTINSIACMF